MTESAITKEMLRDLHLPETVPGLYPMPALIFSIAFAILILGAIAFRRYQKKGMPPANLSHSPTSLNQITLRQLQIEFENCHDDSAGSRYLNLANNTLKRFLLSHDLPGKDVPDDELQSREESDNAVAPTRLARQAELKRATTLHGQAWVQWLQDEADFQLSASTRSGLAIECYKPDCHNSLDPDALLQVHQDLLRWTKTFHADNHA